MPNKKKISNEKIKVIGNEFFEKVILIGCSCGDCGYLRFTKNSENIYLDYFGNEKRNFKKGHPTQIELTRTDIVRIIDHLENREGEFGIGDSKKSIFSFSPIEDSGILVEFYKNERAFNRNNSLWDIIIINEKKNILDILKEFIDYSEEDDAIWTI